MIELRRKALVPIVSGMLVKLTDAAKQRYKLTETYADYGNKEGNRWNNNNKVHIADASVLYCTNSKVFNSKNLIEVIPVRYDHEYDYGGDYQKISIRDRVKFVMKRSELEIIQNPEMEIQSYTYLYREIIGRISKKFKQKFDLWKK